MAVVDAPLATQLLRPPSVDKSSRSKPPSPLSSPALSSLSHSRRHTEDQTLGRRRPPLPVVVPAVSELRGPRHRLRHVPVPLPLRGIEPGRTESRRPTPPSPPPAERRRGQIPRPRRLPSLADPSTASPVSLGSPRTLPFASSPSGASCSRVPPSAAAPEHAGKRSGDLLVNRAAAPFRLAPL